MQRIKNNYKWGRYETDYINNQFDYEWAKHTN